MLKSVIRDEIRREAKKRRESKVKATKAKHVVIEFNADMHNLCMSALEIQFHVNNFNIPLVDHSISKVLKYSLLKTKKMLFMKSYQFPCTVKLDAFHAANLYLALICYNTEHSEYELLISRLIIAKIHDSRIL